MKKYSFLFVFILFVVLFGLTLNKTIFSKEEAGREEIAHFVEEDSLLNEDFINEDYLDADENICQEAWEDSCRGAEEFMVEGVRYSMTPVAGGSFMMGNGLEPDPDQSHRVRLSSFLIGKTEVTRALWDVVMGNSPSNTIQDDYAVANISWDDCRQFISRLNAMTGQKFRLPTEAEWEYAARGGSKSLNYQYSGSDDIYKVAVFQLNNRLSQQVATCHPNELGIYDMSGNVWEWCQDWYEAYDGSPCINPAGPSSGTYRVVRGGSRRCGKDEMFCCTPYYRERQKPSYTSDDLGFRLALSSFKIIPTDDSLHNAVDLGLPSCLKWATCNVGAETPEECGDYFAWGETEGYQSGKSDFSWNTYKWCDGSSNTLTKYCLSGTKGVEDGKTTLERDDAAQANWGGNWRMPSDEEWTELRTECTWTWTTQNGIKGYNVVGPNSNSIFFPASGGYDETTLFDAGSDGYYWSNTVQSTDYNFHSSNALCVHFNSKKVDRMNVARFHGLCIRPVCRY